MNLKNFIVKVASTSAAVIVPAISTISLFSAKDSTQSKVEANKQMRLLIMAKGK